MSDLIDRQAAIDVMKGINRYFVKYIEELPSAQPEIIRCKDCNYSDWYSTPSGKNLCYCMEHCSKGNGENDFCSRAERRTDEDR